MSAFATRWASRRTSSLNTQACTGLGWAGEIRPVMRGNSTRRPHEGIARAEHHDAIVSAAQRERGGVHLVTEFVRQRRSPLFVCISKSCQFAGCSLSYKQNACFYSPPNQPASGQKIRTSFSDCLGLSVAASAIPSNCHSRCKSHEGQIPRTPLNRRRQSRPALPFAEWGHRQRGFCQHWMRRPCRRDRRRRCCGFRHWRQPPPSPGLVFRPCKPDCT